MHVIDSLAVGGAERMLVDIANATLLDGHQVSVCITRSGCQFTHELRPGIKVWILNRRYRFEWKTVRNFARLVNDQKVDVLHIHSRSTFSFLVLLKTLGLIKQPLVLHDHFGSIELDASVPNWFQWWGKYWLSHYVGVYQRLGDWAQAAGIPSHKITIIENALDLSRIQHAPELNLRHLFEMPDHALTGIVVGNLRREKGIDILLAALAGCTVNLPLKIFVIGRTGVDPQYWQACQQRKAELGLSDTVIFLGERSDAISFIKAVDFALVPSRSESGPLVLIEYMAGGLPFVASTVGAVAHRAATAGLPGFVTPGDETELARALEQLLSLSPAKRIKRGQIGQELARQCFDIRSRMSQWYEVYASAMGDKRQ